MSWMIYPKKTVVVWIVCPLTPGLWVQSAVSAMGLPRKSASADADDDGDVSEAEIRREEDKLRRAELMVRRCRLTSG